MTCKAVSHAQYGLFVCSASPAIDEAMCHTGIDWICLDAQHSAIGYETMAQLLMATQSGTAKRIVRVGGPFRRNP
jgi:4-hydroxy-2-oxoheptanedioate aldolase